MILKTVTQMNLFVVVLFPLALVAKCAVMVAAGCTAFLSCGSVSAYCHAALCVVFFAAREWWHG